MSDSPANRLDASLAQAYRDAHLAHGDLGLEENAFKRRVLSIANKYAGPGCSDEAVHRQLRNLHTNDLYLGLACAQRIEVAWNCFDATYRKYVEDLATFLSSTSDASELADTILVDLFLPNHSGDSRIGSFEGRSSLATWLRIIVSHRAINEHERTRNTSNHSESILDIVDQSAQYTVEASLRACRYENLIDDSFRCSCQSLTDRERLMLLLRFDDGLQLGEIARLFGVHQSTITRRLEQTCKKLRNDVITTLSSKHHLNPAAINECQDDILENPSYSILSAIRGATASK